MMRYHHQKLNGESISFRFVNRLIVVVVLVVHSSMPSGGVNRSMGPDKLIKCSRRHKEEVNIITIVLGCEESPLIPRTLYYCSVVYGT
jgi:hypothetical protein